MKAPSRPMTEKDIYDWFTTRHPGGLNWTSPDFDAYRDAPLELRMFVAMEKVEGEIPNGGLPQLLWNTFYHWRKLLDDCETGYGRIGAAPQKQAIGDFRKIFETHERKCQAFISRCMRERDFAYFGKWCKSATPLMKSEKERFFWSSEYADLDKKRKAWIRKNRNTLSQLMKEPPRASPNKS